VIPLFCHFDGPKMKHSICKEIRVDRVLTHADALLVLALASGSGDGTIVVYKYIGNPKQSFDFQDRISKIHNKLYGIDFIYPVLNFRLRVSYANETEIRDIVLLELVEPVKSIKFDPPIDLPSYCDFIVTYACDKQAFQVDIENLDVSKLLTPCYTVGIRHMSQEYFTQLSTPSIHTEVTIDNVVYNKIDLFE